MKNLENNSDLLQDLSIEEMESVNGGNWVKFVRYLFEALGGVAAMEEMSIGWNEAGSSRTASWK